MSMRPRLLVTLEKKDGTVWKEFTLPPGANLWVFLRKNQVPIGASCSGVGVCARCSVEEVLPESGLSSLSAATEREKQVLVQQGKPAHLRLACLSRVQDHVRLRCDSW